MTEQRYLILDYETRSEADLKKVGSFEYSVHPSTRILCVAWRIGTREELKTTLTKAWSPAIPSAYGELIRALEDPTLLIIAHNAGFEQVITRNVLSRIIHKEFLKSIPHERWICTASMAAALALPRKLESACQVLGLSAQKDSAGHKLMLKMSRPRKLTKHNLSKWHAKTSDLKRLIAYCVADVDAETELFLKLPPLSENERKVWLLDQKINFNGFQIDRELVTKVLAMIKEETDVLNEETRKLNGGAFGSTNQRAQVLAWLKSNGVELMDLRAKTVQDALKANLVDGDSKRMLEIRQAISKTSTQKYVAFEQRSRHDGRVRDILVYHGASTGRWSGAGIQPQNFPRGTIKNTDQAAEICREGDLELVRMIYGDPMSVFSSCLRSVIIAPREHELFCGDWAAIEARGLFWIAEHAAGLQAFREERDLYREMAAPIFRKPCELIPKKGPEREIGKRAILGCGYGMGWKKFMQTCNEQGQPVTEEIAQLAVKAYRETHYPVVRLWSNVERAAIAAVLNRGKKYRINKCSWWVANDFLWCELPSGRKLAYHRPEVRFEATPWDEKRPVLYHWSQNPKTRKWEIGGTYGGRLTENIVQAVARDFMSHAMLSLDQLQYRINATIHDEILADKRRGEGHVDEFTKVMATVPAWGAGCPMKVEAWSSTRYRK